MNISHPTIPMASNSFAYIDYVSESGIPASVQCSPTHIDVSSFAIPTIISIFLLAFQPIFNIANTIDFDMF